MDHILTLITLFFDGLFVFALFGVPIVMVWYIGVVIKEAIQRTEASAARIAAYTSVALMFIFVTTCVGGMVQ